MGSKRRSWINGGSVHNDPWFDKRVKKDRAKKKAAKKQKSKR